MEEEEEESKEMTLGEEEEEEEEVEIRPEIFVEGAVTGLQFVLMLVSLDLTKDVLLLVMGSEMVVKEWLIALLVGVLSVPTATEE